MTKNRLACSGWGFWGAWVLASTALVIPSRGGAADYAVDWPAIHLAGGFTLDVRPAFGTYASSAASGTYGGVTWSRVEFRADASFAEVTFFWDQGYTGYAVSPDYVGRSSPWPNATEAWGDLMAKGVEDGVIITALNQGPGPFRLHLTALPAVLWPPNGQRVPVTITAVGETEDGTLWPDLPARIVSVSCNEVFGKAARDRRSVPWLVRGDLALDLVAKRLPGRMNRRVYAITVEADGADGFKTNAVVAVVVPPGAPRSR